MSKRTIAIFGATSAIAKAYARLQCDSQTRIILIGRNVEALANLQHDLVARGVGSVVAHPYDFSSFEGMDMLVDEVFRTTVDIALVAYGTLPNQAECFSNPTYAWEHYMLNSTSTISLLGHIARKMKAQNQGTIAVITSVAGDRGKKSNYFYGAAKASVSIFLQGLRQDLFHGGVHVLDIKPGFVDTPMTKDFKKGFLWAQPDQVAKRIDCAIHSKRNVVYVPFFWKWIMCIIRTIPEFIFKKLSL